MLLENNLSRLSNKYEDKQKGLAARIHSKKALSVVRTLAYKSRQGKDLLTDILDNICVKLHTVFVNNDRRCSEYAEITAQWA